MSPGIWDIKTMDNEIKDWAMRWAKQGWTVDTIMKGAEANWGIDLTTREAGELACDIIELQTGIRPS